MVRMSHQLEKGEKHCDDDGEQLGSKECTYTDAVELRASGLIYGRLSPVGCVQTDTGR